MTFVPTAYVIPTLLNGLSMNSHVNTNFHLSIVQVQRQPFFTLIAPLYIPSYRIQYLLNSLPKHRLATHVQRDLMLAHARRSATVMITEVKGKQTLFDFSIVSRSAEFSKFSAFLFWGLVDMPVWLKFQTLVFLFQLQFQFELSLSL